jgi:hypothetical protein
VWCVLGTKDPGDDSTLWVSNLLAENLKASVVTSAAAGAIKCALQRAVKAAETYHADHAVYQVL